MTEWEFIQRLQEIAEGPLPPQVTQGIGDDASAWKVREGIYGLFSTDSLVEGFHFDIVYTPPHHIGYKAISTAVSDIYAMNGHPLYLWISLGIPPQMPLSFAEEMYKGVAQACAEYNVFLSGGDTVPTRKGGLFLSVSVYGEVACDKVTFRKGAQPYDLICVSGDLGAAYAGLKILQREKAVFLKNPDMQPKVEEFHYVIRRQIHPRARRYMVETLAQRNILPTSMIDVSDGLASELYHLARASQKTFRIYLDRLPFHPETAKVAELFQDFRTHYQLYGGEDYELLFTVPMEKHMEVESIEGVSVIGYVKEGPAAVEMEDAEGKISVLFEGGWDSLSPGQKKASESTP
ncbi:MAG: thiamine-phosphate kinase [Bacteroidia bacterium]